MSVRFANPRLAFLCNQGVLCPGCNSRQQQLTAWMVYPAEWRCRDCRRAYVHEPDGTPTVEDARAALQAALRPREITYVMATKTRTISAGTLQRRILAQLEIRIANEARKGARLEDQRLYEDSAVRVALLRNLYDAISDLKLEIE